MPRQSLQGLQGHAGVFHRADELPAQAVEIEIAPGTIPIGEALGLFAALTLGRIGCFLHPFFLGRRKIVLNHLRGLVPPGAGPKLLAGRLVPEPITHHVGEVRPKRQHVFALVLAVARPDCHGRLGTVEPERLRLQTGQLLRPQSGPASREVEHEPIRSADQMLRLPRAGRVEEIREIFVGKASPFAVVLDVRVERFEGLQGVTVSPVVVHQPAQERFHVAEVVIAGHDG
jgi:hypothetical protein